ncbi:MAG: hypothetical protein LUQ44_05820 [Methanothrix sp.]|nr:hypothetical protein [Methanothrix sp.]
MLPYARIAFILHDISGASRSEKVDLAADLLADLETEMICPVVRLMLGELWPPWEHREMEVGPEAVLAALSKVSKKDVFILRNELEEIGSVAEAALQKKCLHTLLKEPLDAFRVYEGLRRISRMSGPDSEHRKRALLSGMFLEAEPLEGKYIARTALRNMLVGFGPKSLISALSKAFDCDGKDLNRAYNLLPDAGSIAIATMKRELKGIAIEPSRPVKPMIIRPGKVVTPGAFLPKYPGLKVQVHLLRGKIFIFTSNLRDVAPDLNGLVGELNHLKQDLIIDAELVGFFEVRILGQDEILRYINRGHYSRRSKVHPAWLLQAIGEPKQHPFQGISPAEERVLNDRNEADRYCVEALKAGIQGLIARDLQGTYLPGQISSFDSIVGKEETIAAMVVEARFGSGTRGTILERYHVALRDDDELMPVGWVGSGLKMVEKKALSDRLMTLALHQNPEGAKVRPRVSLALKIAGARRIKDGYRLLARRLLM